MVIVAKRNWCKRRKKLLVLVVKVDKKKKIKLKRRKLIYSFKHVGCFEFHMMKKVFLTTTKNRLLSAFIYTFCWPRAHIRKCRLRCNISLWNCIYTFARHHFFQFSFGLKCSYCRSFCNDEGLTTFFRMELLGWQICYAAISFNYNIFLFTNLCKLSIVHISTLYTLLYNKTVLFSLTKRRLYNCFYFHSA